MVINVEYNQLDPLLRATGHPDGDVNNCETGYSPFPGNINQVYASIYLYVSEITQQNIFSIYHMRWYVPHVQNRSWTIIDNNPYFLDIFFLDHID